LSDTGQKRNSKSLSRKDRKRFWERLFEFKVGDLVRVIGVWDGTLKDIRPDLIGRLGTIIKKVTSYHEMNRTTLFPTNHLKDRIPIQTWIVNFGRSECWHMTSEDLELELDG